MPNRNKNLIHCSVCNRSFRLNQLARLDGDDNTLKREIAKKRYEEAGRQIGLMDNACLCLNCNRSINTEIRELENDPTCATLNVLTQTNSSTCFICNGANEHRLSIKTRLQVFLARDIYIPEYVRCCPAHLDDHGNIYRYLLPGLRFIRKLYVIKGTQLMPFLQDLRDGQQLFRI